MLKLFTWPTIERHRHYGVFVCGFVFPWKRWNGAWQAFEWSCGFGYWMWTWGRTYYRPPVLIPGVGDTIRFTLPERYRSFDAVHAPVRVNRPYDQPVTEDDHRG